MGHPLHDDKGDRHRPSGARGAAPPRRPGRGDPQRGARQAAVPRQGRRCRPPDYRRLFARPRHNRWARRGPRLAARNRVSERVGRGVARRGADRDVARSDLRARHRLGRGLWHRDHRLWPARIGHRPPGAAGLSDPEGVSSMSARAPSATTSTSARCSPSNGSSLRGAGKATKQSRASETRAPTRLLRGACPRAARSADPWARNDETDRHRCRRHQHRCGAARRRACRARGQDADDRGCDRRHRDGTRASSRRHPDVAQGASTAS